MAPDIFGATRLKTAPTFDLRPRLERRTCDLAARIATVHGEAHARILNISAGGIGFTTDPVLMLKPGEAFIIRHDRLGDVRCQLRWALHPRYGAEFDAAGKASGAVHAFYDSLPPEPG
ncbi:PilZ domain-containing protein [Aestuariivirga sp.]|uniref:PilZ domain-containing protein n=1 Tax=Aestuariivirga sp. TaxID=2650926 RepID=UPI0039194B9B